MNALDSIVGALAFLARWLVYSGLLYAAWVGSRGALVVVLAWVLVKDELQVLAQRARSRHVERVATALKSRGTSKLMLRRRG